MIYPVIKFPISDARLLIRDKIAAIPNLTDSKLAKYFIYATHRNVLILLGEPKPIKPSLLFAFFFILVPREQGRTFQSQQENWGIVMSAIVLTRNARQDGAC